MPDTWRYPNGAWPEHGYDAQVLHSVLGRETPWASPSGSGESPISMGAGSFPVATYGEAPRVSLPLWTRALVASTVPAATMASVLMTMVIAVPQSESSGSAQRSECRTQLGREQLRLLPGGEVAASVDLVEVGEAGVDHLNPAARGSPELAGERREADGN
jgi:hypothetical protein